MCRQGETDEFKSIHKYQNLPFTNLLTEWKMLNKNQHDTEQNFDVYSIELKAGKDCPVCANGAVRS